MTSKRSSAKVKRISIIIGVLAIFITAAVIILMNKDKSKEENNPEEIDKSEEISVKQKLEYGDDIKDKAFTFDIEDEEREAKFAHLDPEVNTMKVGETVHRLDLGDLQIDVTIIIEDTQSPVMKGIKETIELEGDEIDVEDELRKLITAQDPVDGELDLLFKIEEDKDKDNIFNVTVDATDANDNKTTEKFKVIVKQAQKEEDNTDIKDETKKPSSKGTSSNSASNSAKKKQEKPKQTKPKGDSNGSGGGTQSSKGPKLKEPKQGLLPSGSSRKQKENSSHTYAYKKNLPGGGNISEVIASVESGRNTIYVIGKDNKGKEYMGIYSPDQLEISYSVALPIVTSDGFNLIYDIAGDFAVAYGWQDIYRMMEINIILNGEVHYHAANTNSKTLGEELDWKNKYDDIKFTFKKASGGRVIHSFDGVANNDKYEWVISSDSCKGGVCSKNIDSIKLDKEKDFMIIYQEK